MDNLLLTTLCNIPLAGGDTIISDFVDKKRLSTTTRATYTNLKLCHLSIDWRFRTESVDFVLAFDETKAKTLQQFLRR